MRNQRREGKLAACGRCVEVAWTETGLIGKMGRRAFQAEGRRGAHSGNGTETKAAEAQGGEHGKVVWSNEVSRSGSAPYPASVIPTEGSEGVETKSEFWVVMSKMAGRTWDGGQRGSCRGPPGN